MKKKRIRNGIFFSYFQYHFCPMCKSKLLHKKNKKIVKSTSSSSKNYDFGSGEFELHGDIEFIFDEYECNKCNKNYNAAQVKRFEKEKKCNSKSKL